MSQWSTLDLNFPKTVYKIFCTVLNACLLCRVLWPRRVLEIWSLWERHACIRSHDVWLEERDREGSSLNKYWKKINLLHNMNCIYTLSTFIDCWLPSGIDYGHVMYNGHPSVTGQYVFWPGDQYTSSVTLHKLQAFCMPELRAICQA